MTKDEQAGEVLAQIPEVRAGWVQEAALRRGGATGGGLAESRRADKPRTLARWPRGGRTNRSQPRAWSWNQPAPDDETQEGEGKRQDQRILLENRARESQRPPAVGTAKRAPGRGQTRDVIPRRKKTTTGLWGAPRLRMARKKNVNLKKKNQCSQRPTADVTERASQGRERA